MAHGFMGVNRGGLCGFMVLYGILYGAILGP